jgi:hypothetical protein
MVDREIFFVGNSMFGDQGGAINLGDNLGGIYPKVFMKGGPNQYLVK